MMASHPLSISTLCLLFSVSMSLRCFTGTGQKCFAPHPDTEMCSTNDRCQCIAYRYRCSEDNDACTEGELMNGATKWQYNLVTAEICQQMQADHSFNMLSNVTCCSTDECNRPQGIKCIQL